jgi:hypothetical protein
MDPIKKILLYFVLPLIAILAYPPATLIQNPSILAVIALAFALLAVLLWRGSSRALTLTIFIQGLNIIIRIMTFFTQSIPRSGPINYPYMVLTMAAILLSLYLLLRLDKPDVRMTLVT